jgi:hypothetical protein
MLCRSLAVAALTLASSGAALAQSIYLYVAPGASVFVSAPGNDLYGAPAAAYGGAVYGAPIAAPLPALDGYGPSAEYVAPASVYAPGPGYGPGPAYAPPSGYDAPLQLYGALTGRYAPGRNYARERAYVAARPPAPVPDRSTITVRTPRHIAAPGARVSENPRQRFR